MVYRRQKFRANTYELPLNQSKDSPISYFKSNNCRDFSSFSKNLMIITGNEYSDKLHRLWNNFDKPAEPSMKKYQINSGNLQVKNKKLCMKNYLNKKKSISCNSHMIRTNLPPIKKIVSGLGFNDIYQNWQVDSDDEDAILPIHKY